MRSQRRPRAVPVKNYDIRGALGRVYTGLTSCSRIAVRFPKSQLLTNPRLMCDIAWKSTFPAALLLLLVFLFKSSMFLVVPVATSPRSAAHTQRLIFPQRKLSREIPGINRIIPVKKLECARRTGFGVKFGQHPVLNLLAGENRNDASIPGCNSPSRDPGAADDDRQRARRKP
jgi:hypothetical protein